MQMEYRPVALFKNMKFQTNIMHIYYLIRIVDGIII